MSIKIEFWGDYACFTRPEMKVERVSYDVPTTSAARGMVESIYFHPEIQWLIKRIYVCNPIEFTCVRRNEFEDKVSHKSMYNAMAGKGISLYAGAAKMPQQRATIMLKNVRYVIEAEFRTLQPESDRVNSGKYSSIIKRRLRKGACYSQPYFGIRECTAHFGPWEGGDVPTIQETRDLGYMVHDFDYSDPQNIQPMFFRAQMTNGVIDLRDCEVVR